MDIYELFFLLLIIYTQRHRFLPDMAKHHRRLGKIESGSTLTILGAMLMKSLGISSISIRGYLGGTLPEQDPLSKPLVEFERITHGWRTDVTSVHFLKCGNEQDLYVFNTGDYGITFRPRLRGTGVDLQLDQVYRARDSDVGIVLRRGHKYDEPVAWVVIGVGHSWKPDQETWSRFEILQRGRLPAPIDFGRLPDDSNFPGIAIAVDWHVAMSIIDGLSQTSTDRLQPDDAHPSKKQPKRARGRQTLKECTCKHYVPLYHYYKPDVVDGYCTVRGRQQSTERELEYLFE